MNLQDLKAAYLSRHAMSLDDSATLHLRGFVAFLEEALASLEPAEPLALAEGETLEQMVANATAKAVETARTAWEGELQAHVEGAVEAARLAWEEEAAKAAAVAAGTDSSAAPPADGKAAAAEAPAEGTPPADPPAA